MAPKKNKSKNLFITKEAIGKRPNWPELPPELIQLSYRKRNLLRCVSSPGTTKSWLTTTRRCNTSAEQYQWPQLYHLNNSSNSSSTSYPHNHFLDDPSVPLVSQRPNASYWCILKVDTTSSIYPSSTASSNYVNPRSSTLFSNYVNPRAVLVKLDSISSSALMVFYVTYINSTCVWIRHECTTVDPFDAKKKYMKFTSIVRFEGRFYALSLQGALAVMQNVDSRLRITAISTSRAVPSVSSRFFKEYLVELNGEILLVFLIHKKSLRVVDKVEVFRLGFLKLDWIKVERLQGKTLFLDQCCIWVNSAKIGCRENCIYFTQGLANGWRIYDMESRCISTA